MCCPDGRKCCCVKHNWKLLPPPARASGWLLSHSALATGSEARPRHATLDVRGSTYKLSCINWKAPRLQCTQILNCSWKCRRCRPHSLFWFIGNILLIDYIILIYWHRFQAHSSTCTVTQTHLLVSTATYQPFKPPTHSHHVICSPVCTLHYIKREWHPELPQRTRSEGIRHADWVAERKCRVDELQ